jgi:hypothetical protein
MEISSSISMTITGFLSATPLLISHGAEQVVFVFSVAVAAKG